MNSIVDQIIQTKRQEVARLRNQVRPSELLKIAANQPQPRGFFARLQQPIKQHQPALIAEIKKASPSQGVIRVEFEPDKHAQDYQKHGASCLSVLTDKHYFQGYQSHLQQASKACNLPILRKDFIIDELQIMASRAMGADAVLLILAVLDDAHLSDLYQTAEQLGLDVVLEAHSSSEIERAMRLEPSFIGVNNRDLRTFKVDRQISLTARQIVPEPIAIISESGIDSPQAVRQLFRAGIQAFLVGEYCMRQANPGEALSKLFEGSFKH